MARYSEELLDQIAPGAKPVNRIPYWLGYGRRVFDPMLFDQEHLYCFTEGEMHTFPLHTLRSVRPDVMRWNGRRSWRLDGRTHQDEYAYFFFPNRGGWRGENTFSQFLDLLAERYPLVLEP